MGDLKYPDNIYLVGMPGSGKSTLGKQLAEKLNADFYDLDLCIEKEAGKDINRIFSEDGESGFRLLERQCLEDLSRIAEIKVIATGGGTPCFHQNIDYMNAHGVSVFLNVPLEIILERLLDQGTDARPLLRNKSATELLGQLHDHFQLRKSHYMKALIHLDGGAISLETILNGLASL
ncbi:MAG: shikimate kinase [Cyclobacteriaceae bacterium]|nr:MAG: shikimate kinase [Cyclobacteriaceae bacterium]